MSKNDDVDWGEKQDDQVQNEIDTMILMRQDIESVGKSCGFHAYHILRVQRDRSQLNTEEIGWLWNEFRREFMRLNTKKK